MTNIPHETAEARAVHGDGFAVLARVRAEGAGGFLTELDVRILAHDERTRLQPLLVRCHRCRFLTPAQDVEYLVKIIEQTQEASGVGAISDGVRDVSLPVGDGRWTVQDGFPSDVQP